MSKEKIKTRKCIECKKEFYSNYDKSEVCPTCHYKNKQKEKDQRIAELEEQLKNAIVPKFKIGQECYALLGKDIEIVKIHKIIADIAKLEDETFTRYSITDSNGYACRMVEEQIFATEEEAKAKLKEIQGE